MLSQRFRIPAILVLSGILISPCARSAQIIAPRPESGNLIANPGFEQLAGDRLEGWFYDSAEKLPGSIETDSSVRCTGARSLKVVPNEKNTDKEHPLGPMELISVEKFRGKRLRVGAMMRVDGGCGGATIALSVDDKGKIQEISMCMQQYPTRGFMRQDAYINVKPDTKSVIVGCVTTGTKGSAWFDDVSLVEDNPVDIPTSSKPLIAAIDVNAGQVIRTIPKTLFGNNLEWIWYADNLWDPATGRTRPAIVSPAKELGIGPLRFPGGFFSDYYHWREGIGPREKRPSRPHGPGLDTSPNAFGTDDLASFCREIGAEPLITVNMITGTAQEAADWIHYCNDPVNAERAQNGSVKPYGVRFWEIGNEQYLRGDDAVGMQSCIAADEYIRRYKEWSSAMKQADPSIKLVAIGASNYGRNIMTYDEDWVKKLLAQAGGSIDYLSLHNAYAVSGASSANATFNEVYQALLTFPLLVDANLKKVGREIDTYAPAYKDKIKLALTEWGPLFAIDPKDKWIDHCKTLGSGLYVGSILRTLIQNPRVELATFFKITEYSFMGCIGGDGTPKPSYYALQMYTRHFGNQVVGTSVKSPTFDTRPVMQIDPMKDVPYLEAVSSLSQDKSRMYIMVINKHFTTPIKAKLNLNGFIPKAQGKAWVMTAPSLDANNGKDLLDVPGLNWGEQISAPTNPMFKSGKPGTVTIRPAEIKGASQTFEYTFPPISMVCLELTRKSSPKR